MFTSEKDAFYKTLMKNGVIIIKKTKPTPKKHFSRIYSPTKNDGK